MNPALDVEAAIELAKFIQSTVALYQAGTLTDKQLSDIWHAAGVNVANAEKLWKAAGSSGTSSAG